VLVSGDASDPDIWLAVKYDTQPAMGGHAHPDVLSFVWYADGRMISADPGIAEYGAPVHGGWYKTTLAHNTLVVDERSQPIRGARSLAFGEAAGIKYSVVAADGIYDGIGYRRAVIVPDRSTVLVVDGVQAKLRRRNWILLTISAAPGVRARRARPLIHRTNLRIDTSLNLRPAGRAGSIGLRPSSEATKFTSCFSRPIPFRSSRPPDWDRTLSGCRS
jgi:hypothetical protein